MEKHKNHSNLSDQNLFHSSIDVPPAVPGVSKNLDDQTEVYSGELVRQISAKIEETVKNRQNWTKVVKETCFLEVFWILINLGWILVLQLTKVVFKLVFQIFDTPGTPGGVLIVEISLF